MTRAGSARAGRRRRWPGGLRAVAGTALAVAAIVAGTATAQAAGAQAAGAQAAGAQAAGAQAAGAQAGSTSCGTATGPFSVHGVQVLGQGGKPFVSYGITVPGLQGLNWAPAGPLDQQKIAATAAYWCANTVRLQLSQDNLLGPDGTSFSPAYMTAIESEVSAAEQDHMVVVLNDNTEFAAPAVRISQRGPTPATERFWKDLADVYGNDPQVIFDLFNEPRTYSAGMSQAQEWQLWLNGGWFQGVYYPFGMATLANYVRNTVRAQNLFWIEGPGVSASFAGMAGAGALLKVSGVVYAVHHPSGIPDTTSWDAGFGYLVTSGLAPVVDGEWTNYEPAPTTGPAVPRSSCWPDASTKVPEYLQYLAAHGIGLNVYQLQPGYMIKSYGNLADPTTINAGTWSCVSTHEAQPGQGAGALVMAWFKQRNG